MADNKKKQENAINAVTETDNPTIRKGLYDRIAQLEAAQKEIEAAIAQEVIPFPSLTEPKIRFFLTALGDGSVKDIKYRKMLIRLFVNRIYLYDDHLTTTFNTGEDTVEINDRLLAELEENSDKERLLFKGKDGPGNRYLHDRPALCHGLLVYAAVQQSGDEEVTQGVQMVFGVESISGVNLPQALGECIGMDERAVCVCKPAWSATSPCGAARTAGATLPRQAASARNTATAHRSTAKQAVGR